jgi:hypothetical protein
MLDIFTGTCSVGAPTNRQVSKCQFSKRYATEPADF